MPPSPSRSGSSLSCHDQLSVHSFLTSSEVTTYSDHHKPIDHLASKLLPAIPPDEPYAFHPQQAHPYAFYHPPQIHPLTSIDQLATALGPDNTPYSTEIATIPCAGVRISHGSLSGLIAWRLVVSFPSPVKAKRGWWTESPAAAKNRRRNSFIPFHHSDTPQSTWTSTSAVSLPLTYTPLQMPLDRPVASASHLPIDHPRPPHLSHRSVVSNFILDTSLPYSIISRDTLLELGYPSYRLPPPDSSDPHSNDWQDLRHPDAIVTLSIQNIPTRLRIARPGEASRLGVQFLQDASVSIFFPKDGEGVGPVLYSESAYLLKDAPRTITPLEASARAHSKHSLPHRVRALFGLA